MTTQLNARVMNSIADFRRRLTGAVSDEDIVKAVIALSYVDDGLRAIYRKLEGELYEACPHKWKIEPTNLAKCKLCNKNNGLVEKQKAILVTE